MDDYPTMPTRLSSLKILTIASLLNWWRYPDWREIREYSRTVFLWMVVFVALVLYALLAPISIPVVYWMVRREQRRVFVLRKRRWLKNRLRYACKGWD